MADPIAFGVSFLTVYDAEGVMRMIGKGLVARWDVLDTGKEEVCCGTLLSCHPGWGMRKRV